jgi:hypothetical protein
MEQRAEDLGLEPLVLLLLAAGGPGTLRLADNWPLHRVLAEASADTAWAPWLPPLTHRPDPLLVRRVCGLDDALLALATAGGLVPTAGPGWRPSRPARATATRHLRALDHAARDHLTGLARRWWELAGAEAERRGRLPAAAASRVCRAPRRS